MKLYYFETLNPRMVCALARHLEAPVDYVRVDLGKGENRTPEFLALNPNGKVPVLDTGKGAIWESNAILCHLARAAGSDLWPEDAGRQVEIVRWLCWNGEHFKRHAGSLYFEYVIKPHFGIGEPDAALVEEASGHVRTFGQVLNEHLAGRRWLVGDALTVADFAVAAALPYAEQARLPIEGFPEILRWHAQLEELPAWREPFPAVAAAA